MHTGIHTGTATRTRLLPCGVSCPLQLQVVIPLSVTPSHSLYPCHNTDMSLGWHLWDLSIIWKQLNVLAKCTINVPLCHRVHKPLNDPLCLVTLAYFRASLTATLWLTTTSISNSYACNFPWNSGDLYYVKTKMKTKTRPNKLIKWTSRCAAIWNNSWRLEQKRLPRSNQCLAIYIPLQAQQNDKWQRAKEAEEERGHIRSPFARCAAS